MTPRLYLGDNLVIEHTLALFLGSLVTKMGHAMVPLTIIIARKGRLKVRINGNVHRSGL